MASPSDSDKKVDAEIDDELDELLDSALQDFGKESERKPRGAAKDDEGGGAKANVSSAGDPISDLFAEEFSDEMSKQFEDAMKSFMGNDPAMLKQIEKLAEAAGNAGDSETAQKEFGDTLKDTLNNLAHNTEELQDHGTEPGMDENLMKMFAGMGMDGGASPDDGFMPMMQGMMKTLLSKEVLYPSLKDIADKYPEWLKNNKEKVSATDYSNYEKQHKLIGDILAEFDKEQPADTDDVKRQRFETITDLMQKMQDLGQPPKEIVGDMAPGLDFDANGVPKFPGLPGAQEGCSIM